MRRRWRRCTVAAVTLLATATACGSTTSFHSTATVSSAQLAAMIREIESGGGPHDNGTNVGCAIDVLGAVRGATEITAYTISLCEDCPIPNGSSSARPTVFQLMGDQVVSAKGTDAISDPSFQNEVDQLFPVGLRKAASDGVPNSVISEANGRARCDPS